ncbi:unnamed protein product [Pieris brassicae]|uniref:Uncharacterized protein n=1 Tax=Pieris brassicae TaxID=7116 RepID=A0A9P0TMA6_PIEBR|nr:unnamed protein product [Pieris brassicae]
MDNRVVILLAILLTSGACYSVPAYQGPSQYPSCPCTKIMFPVCASDGNSFNNPYAMNISILRSFHIYIILYPVNTLSSMGVEREVLFLYNRISAHMCLRHEKI